MQSPKRAPSSVSDQAPPVRSGNRLSHGLVAFGTGAVLAVYSAGYLQTRAAADLLDEADARRLPPPPPAIHEALPVLDVHPPSAPEDLPVEPGSEAPAATIAAAASLQPVTDVEPTAIEDPTTAARATDPDSAGETPTPEEAKTDPPAVATGTTPAAAPKVAADVTTAAPVAEDTTATAAGSPAPASTPTLADVVTTPTAAAVPETDTAAALEAPPSAPLYKDGSYSGWGTSRHGDIEATVVIEGGRIASARISQCWTRYPCTWITKLPPQVAERQSPEVDYVSGATQSTNAFYYAVVEALRKAK